VGKSHAVENPLQPNLTVADSDSSKFSWCKSPATGLPGQPLLDYKVRDDRFPENYLDHIETSDADIILVSTHKELLEGLVARGLDFFLVYPSRDQKDEYLVRCTVRGSSLQFIAMLDQMWNSFINDIENFNLPPDRKVVLRPGQFLSDVIEAIWMIGQVTPSSATRRG